MRHQSLKVSLGTIILLVLSGCGERQRTEDCIRRHLNAISRFDRFCQFHRANPRIWELFCYFADGMRKIKNRYSARAIFHRLRWEMELQTNAYSDEDDSQKLCDHYSPYYARMYLATHPQAEGFFILKKRPSEDRSAYKNDMVFYDTGPATDEEDLMQKLAELADESATPPSMREPGQEG